MLIATYVVTLFLIRALVLRWIVLARSVGLLFILSGVSPVSAKG